MDMMDTAVAREGSSNQMMDAGMGLAMGQMFGGMMGQQMAGQVNKRHLHSAAPPPMATTYHYNGAGGQGQFSAQQIAQHVAANRTGAHNVWAQGWSTGKAWQQVPEIVNLVPPSTNRTTTNAGAPSIETYHYNEDGENRGEQPSNVIAQSVQTNPSGKHLCLEAGDGWMD